MYKSTKSITWTTQKIIALVLLGLSFIMFFLPWMSISVKYRGERYSFGELIEYAAGLDGYSWAELEEELYDSLYDASYELEDEGITLNPERAMKTVELIMDSKFSPFDVVRLCSFSGSLLRQFNRYMNDNMDDLYASQIQIASAVKEASVKVTLATIFTIILLIVVLAGFLLGVYMILTDRKLGLIPYLAGAVLFFVIFVIMTIGANSQMKQVYNRVSLGYWISDLFSEIGVNISSSALNIFHITAAGILCVLFAAGALCMVLLVKQGARPSIGPGKKWICPSCGGTMDMGAAFCYKCGTKRPEAKRCVNCGSPIENGAAFCIKCGTPVAGSGYPGHGGGPGVREEKKICVNCGSPIENGAAFCIKCGTPVARGGYPGHGGGPGVREEKKICAKCGSPIENGAAFCIKCGTPVAGSGHPGHDVPIAREPRKTCPACGKSIPETAAVCSFCGYDFNNSGKKFWGTLAKPDDDDML